MELKKQRTNFIVALIVLVIAVVTWGYIVPSQIRLNALWGGTSGVTSRTFPRFACGLAALAAIGEMIQSGLRYRQLKKEHAQMEHVPVQWRNELRALIIFALCVIYAVLFSMIGYIAATLIVPPIMLLVLGNRKWQHYVSVYAVGAAIYVVFVYLLQIRLP